MEYNGVLGEEKGHKTPSPNAFAGGKTLSPNIIFEGEKERREMEGMEDEGRRNDKTFIRVT